MAAQSAWKQSNVGVSVVYSRPATVDAPIHHQPGTATLPADLRPLLPAHGRRDADRLQLVYEPCRESVAQRISLDDDGATERFELGQDAGIAARQTVVPFRGDAAAQQLRTQAREEVSAVTAVPHCEHCVPAPHRATFKAPLAATPVPTNEHLRAHPNELSNALLPVLGDDSAAVIERVSNVADEAQFATLVRKFLDILRNDPRSRKAEHFIQIHDTP